jgi:hypothetical protein
MNVAVQKDPRRIDFHTRRRCLRVISIQIWFHKFRNGDLSYKVSITPSDHPDFGPQLETFRQNYPFPNAPAIAHRFLAIVLIINDILQKRLGMKNFSRCLVPHFRSSGHKAARVKASKEILRILQEPKTNHFDRIATGDESWFRYFYLCSNTFAQSPAEVIPRRRWAIGADKLWSRYLSLLGNYLFSTFCQKAANLIGYPLSIACSGFKGYTWIFAVGCHC